MAIYRVGNIGVELDAVLGVGEEVDVFAEVIADVEVFGYTVIPA